MLSGVGEGQTLLSRFANKVLEAPTVPAVRLLLERHLAEMREVSPEGSIYALDVAGLSVPEVTLWALRSGEDVAACGALKELDPGHAEIKSVHTHSDWRGRGVGRRFVQLLIQEARNRGYERLSLETGSEAPHAPARHLYASLGFEPCGPFADYGPDPHSAFMTLAL